MNQQPPSEKIAREWYLGRGIEYEGVDLGKCIEYDALQIVNRLLLEHKIKNEQPPRPANN